MDDLETPILKFCDALTEKLQDRTKHLSVEKILIDLSGLVSDLPDFEIYVRQKKFFRTEDEPFADFEYLLLPYLSFRVVDGKLVRFQGLEECVEKYREAADDFYIDWPSVALASKDREIEDIEFELTSIADAINQVYHVNIYDDMVEASALKLTRLMHSTNETYSISDLLEYLRDHYREVDGLSLLSFSRDKTSREISLVKSQDYGRAAPDVSHGILDSINYAMYKRRVSDGYEVVGQPQPINYACIPVIDRFAEKFSERNEFQCVLVFSMDSEVDEFLVRFARRGVQGAVDAQGIDKQTATLHSIDKTKRKLISNVRSGHLRNEVDRMSFIVPQVHEFVEGILDCTSAHSVTVRAIDPFEDKLELVAEACYDSARYEDSDEKSIKTTNLSSLNVQSFLNGEPGSHLYVPKMRGTGGPTTATAEHHNPRRSKCEACFPIWKAGVPFGTLNVEGATNGGLEPDLPFLGWVAVQLGDLFYTVSDTIPTDAVAQLSTANELAHGSLSFGAEFTEEELEGLTQSGRSTIEAWAAFETGYRTPVSFDGSDDDGRVDLRGLVIYELRSAVTPRVWRDMNVNWIVPFKDVQISTLEAENIKGILQTVLSNADRHSKISEDYLRVFVLQRGGSQCMFIRYRSIFRKIPCREARDFGTVPVIKDGMVRYGAFLMGERVRAANGVLTVNRPDKAQNGLVPLEFVIGIPMRFA